MKIDLSHHEAIALKDALLARVHELRRLAREGNEGAQALEGLALTLLESLSEKVLRAAAKEMYDAYAEDATREIVSCSNGTSEHGGNLQVLVQFQNMDALTVEVAFSSLVYDSGEKKYIPVAKVVEVES